MIEEKEEEELLPSLHLHGHSQQLRCPYEGCHKSFDRPSILTDSTTLPRKSFYACPHCQSKIDIVAENLKVVEIKPIDYPKVFDSPTKCARFSGFLSAVSCNKELPDECLVCPKVLQCTVRKPWNDTYRQFLLPERFCNRCFIVGCVACPTDIPTYRIAIVECS